MKVAINRCYGGFGLSAEATLWLVEQGSDLIEQRDEKEALNWGSDELRRLTIESRQELRDGWITYGGLSDDQIVKDGVVYSAWNARDNRTHPDVIAVIEALGPEVASGRYAELKIVEIPDGTEYEIDEYDGIEHIAETHRTWS